MLNRNNDVCGAIRRIDLYSFIAWMYARSTVVGSKPGEHTVVSRLPRKRRCLQSIDVCPLLFLGQSTQIRFKRAIELRNYVIRSKPRVDRFGRGFGDKPLARGALYLMLQNRLYRGEVVHKEAAYPGEHPAIIDAALWETVQAKLSDNRVARVNGEHAEAPSLLAGLVYDETGERMSPTHAKKQGKRYRYYVSQALIKGRRGAVPLGRRVPAGELEALL